MPHLLGEGGHYEILWSRSLQPSGSCQLLSGASSLSTGKPLSRSKPAQEQ